MRARLGAGSFGTVYRAYDPQLEREVALKVPQPGTLQHPTAVERFLREARAAARLRHPHIVPVHEAGSDGTCHYIASALIEGQSLAQAIHQGPISFRQAAEVIRDLAEALEHAHQQGIIHRDVKPANVLLDTRGRAYLTDFGLARRREAKTRLTRTGVIVGTPEYMAPEQASGQRSAARPASDQYSLGAVLYELLCGEAPFVGPMEVVLYNALHGIPRPPHSVHPGVPRDLEAICLKAMAKRVEDRYASCQELADALRSWLAGEKIPTTRAAAPASSRGVQEPAPVARPAGDLWKAFPPCSIPAQPPAMRARRSPLRQAVVLLGILGLVFGAGGLAGFGVYRLLEKAKDQGAETAYAKGPEQTVPRPAESESKKGMPPARGGEVSPKKSTTDASPSEEPDPSRPLLRPLLPDLKIPDSLPTNGEPSPSSLKKEAEGGRKGSPTGATEPATALSPQPPAPPPKLSNSEPPSAPPASTSHEIQPPPGRTEDSQLPAALRAPVARLKDGEIDDRVKAADELAAMGRKALPAARALCEAAMDSSPMVAHQALQALEKVSPDLYDPVFILIVDNKVDNHQKAFLKLSTLAGRAKPAEPVIFHAIAAYRERFSTYFDLNLATLIQMAMHTLVRVASDDAEAVTLIGDLADLSFERPILLRGSKVYTKTPFRSDGVSLLGELAETHVEHRKLITPRLVSILQDAAKGTDSRQESEALLAMNEVVSVGNALIKCGPEGKQALRDELLPRLNDLKFHGSEQVRRAAAELSQKVEDLSK